MSDINTLPLWSGREPNWLEVTTVKIHESKRRQNGSLNEYNDVEKIFISFSMKLVLSMSKTISSIIHTYFTEWEYGGACRESIEHVVFECTRYDSLIQQFWTTWSKFLLQKHLRLIIIAAFSLSCVLFEWKKQGMLVNNECQSCHKRVGVFKFQFGIGR